MGFQLSPLKSWTWWWLRISFPRQSTTSWWDGREAGGGSWLFCLCRVFLPVSVRRRRSSRLSQRKAWRNSRRKQRKLQRRLRNRPKWSVVVCFSLLCFDVSLPLNSCDVLLWRHCEPSGVGTATGGQSVHCSSIPVIFAVFMSTQSSIFSLDVQSALLLAVPHTLWETGHTLSL